MSNDIGLAEIINKIKQDLNQTNKEFPTFLVEKVEVELTVTFSKGAQVEASAQAQTDLKINVLSFDLAKLGKLDVSGKASGEISQNNVHKIKLALTPALLNENLRQFLKPEEVEKIKSATMKLAIQGESQPNERI